MGGMQRVPLAWGGGGREGIHLADLNDILRLEEVLGGLDGVRLVCRPGCHRRCHTELMARLMSLLSCPEGSITTVVRDHRRQV